jgi:hypothetical protein
MSKFDNFQNQIGADDDGEAGEAGGDEYETADSGVSEQSSGGSGRLLVGAIRFGESNNDISIGCTICIHIHGRYTRRAAGIVM